MRNSILERFVQCLCVEKGLSEATGATYRYQVLAYLKFMEGRSRRPGQATREDILAYLEARREARLQSSSLFTAVLSSSECDI